MSRWACSLTSLDLNILKIKGILSSLQPWTEWRTLGEKEGLCEVFLVTSQVSPKSQNKRKGGSNDLCYSQQPAWNTVLHWEMTLKKRRNCFVLLILQRLWSSPCLFLSTNIVLAFRMQREFWKTEPCFCASTESDGAISTQQLCKDG